MAEISLNSHDLLGKLGLVKNLLAVVLESETSIGEKTRNYIKKASEINQDLIDFIKNNGKNINC